MSADYMDRLLRETRATLPAVYLDLEVGQVHDELELLSDSATRFRTAARTGMEQLFNTLVRPRLRPLLDECLRDVSYVLDEDRFADAEEADIVRRRFARAWDGVVDGFKDAFTDHNYQAFFNMTVETLVRPWEKMVMGMQFTEVSKSLPHPQLLVADYFQLGAIRYERDIRGVANYLSTQANYGGARDKFTRLQQIATVLNLDADDDPDEFFANSGIPWRLSRNEYNTVVGLRQ
jgi:hypothetical protein